MTKYKNRIGKLLLVFFMIPLHLISQENISRLEYFIDNDPGFGAGITVAVNASPVLNDIPVSINVDALSNGFHNVYFRSRSINGWSITNRLLFFKQQSNATGVTKMEYFVDGQPDPGFGFATDIPITPGAIVNNAATVIDISALQYGPHNVYVRSRDNLGHWSITNRWLFLKQQVFSSMVSKMEYYIDSKPDPGFGKATPIPIGNAPVINDMIVAINADELKPGINNVYLRACDNNGSWSITNRWFLFNDRDARISLVDKMEYFYDTDPGFGNGIPVAIIPTASLPDYMVAVNVTGLSAGQHVVYMRARSQTGWSLTNKDTFMVQTSIPSPFIVVNSVTQAVDCSVEYFEISFEATGTYNAGNVFTAQLSDENGSFASPVNIGSVSATKSSIISCHLPANLPPGNDYHVRVVSSDAPVTGIANIQAISFHGISGVGNDTTVYIVCSGETFNLVPLFSAAGYTTAGWNTPNPMQAGQGSYQFIVSNVNGCTDTAMAIVKQDVAIWTGAASGNWHDAANWNTGRIPNEKTHVIVSGTAINPCQVTDADGLAASVQLTASGTIQLLNNRKLLVAANCNPLPH